MKAVDVEVADIVLMRALFPQEDCPTMLVWVTCDIPEDARLLGIRPSGRVGTWLLRLESEVFEDVPTGAVVPRRDVVLMSHYERLEATS